jgi:transposase
MRRIWAPRGGRPVAEGHHRYRWLYLYGFVRPATGAVVWFIADAVNTAALSAILTAFAREVGAGAGKHVILVLDQAGWHVAGALEVPEGMELMFLPPSSPEIQPAEHLWPLTDEPIANEYFETLDDLDRVLSQRCCILVDEPDLIKAHTLFHWWPAYN